jgi:hypothetical protein
MLEEVQDFGRRHPGWFLAGALGLGVLAGRALRAAPAARESLHSNGSSAGRPSRSRPGVAPSSIDLTDGTPPSPVPTSAATGIETGLPAAPTTPDDGTARGRY